jgi:hypothetical protein
VALQTEFDFTLPKGFVDRDGALHRHGTMRLATARDEIEPLRDPRVTGADDPFLTILVISRVVKSLGTLPAITTDTVENLFAADLAFLQDLYGIINFGNPADAAVLQAAVLPDEEPSFGRSEPSPDALDGSGYWPDDGTQVQALSEDGQMDDELRALAASRRRSRIEEVGSRTVP